MRRVLIILAILTFIMYFITSCAENEETSMMEVDDSSFRKDQLAMQMLDWEQKNGAYLVQYQDKNEYYLYLNAMNVAQGCKATCFESITVDFKNNTMHIYYIEKETDDDKNIRNNVWYKIPVENSVDSIRIYRNGQETHFNSINVF